MFRRKKRARDRVAETASAVGKDVAEVSKELAGDEKFRRRLLSATAAVGVAATAARAAADRDVQKHLIELGESVAKARDRVLRRKRSHKLRNTIVALGATGAAVAVVPKLRSRFAGNGTAPGEPATVEEEIEVGVPVSTAYNQWTQFEDFPLFMEGVDHVEQLDDTLLRWAASIGGKRAEWEAKIVEQQPDTRIAWESVDGRETRGTVSFDKVGEDRSRIKLAMTYRPQGPIEKVGSAAGLDRRRIRGDLERFRDLVESRGVESGAWRGEVESGEVESGPRPEQLGGAAAESRGAA